MWLKYEPIILKQNFHLDYFHLQRCHYKCFVLHYFSVRIRVFQDANRTRCKQRFENSLSYLSCKWNMGRRQCTGDRRQGPLFQGPCFNTEALATLKHRWFPHIPIWSLWLEPTKQRSPRSPWCHWCWWCWCNIFRLHPQQVQTTLNYREDLKSSHLGNVSFMFLLALSFIYLYITKAVDLENPKRSKKK